MPFPITVIDNFFSDPNAILSKLNRLELFATPGNYPGVRSRALDLVDLELNKFIMYSILDKFYTIDPGFGWISSIQYQVINPFTPNDPQHPKNKGWIHRDDNGKLATAIIYLNESPDPNTGTSIYKPKEGYFSPVSMLSKEAHYSGKDVDEDEYIKCWHLNNDQFEKTITVENVFNRMFLFDTNSYHGVDTFGFSQPRKTLVVFLSNVISSQNLPLLR